ARVELSDYTCAVVDDTVDNRRIMSLMLGRAGARCQLYDSGEKLLRHLLRLADPDDLPSIVLMDLQMPGLSGEETVRRLRDMGFDLPVLALSADASTGAAERARRAGCDGYMAKPVIRRELIETIRRLVNGDRSNSHMRRNRVEEDDEFALPAWAIERFAESLLEHAEELVVALREGDARALKLISHGLAGSAG
ncbi:MAG: response regulator, partial [bacterium]|nr:response regulator [bacterium]